MFLRTVILAFPLLAGPWLALTGCMFIQQAVTGDPAPELSLRMGSFAMGAICFVWTLHGIVTGLKLVWNWWVLFCAVANVYFGISAVCTPSDPAYLQYVIVPATLGWSFWLCSRFIDRRQAAHDASPE